MWENYNKQADFETSVMHEDLQSQSYKPTTAGYKPTTAAGIHSRSNSITSTGILYKFIFHEKYKI